MTRFYEMLWSALLIIILIGGIAPAIAQPPALGSADKPIELSWIDAETGKVLFTLSDIVRFDWDRQIFELTPAAATQLLALPVVQRREFAVKDREGVVYRGRFYRSAAADGDGYDGTTILIDQGPLKKLPASPFFTIYGGYPTGGGAHDRDRYSERLRAILVNAGLLTTIPDTDIPIQRLWSGHIWVGGEQVLKASAVLFPETFRIGKGAYIHLLLFKGQRPDFQFDKMVVYATCVAEGGKFTSRQEILTITPPLLDNGIYVCKFSPWEALIIPPAGDNAYSPTVVTSSPPRYPKDALNEDREGKVTVALTVESDGKVSGTTMVSSSGYDDLDRSVERSLPKYTFAPVKRNGNPVQGMLKLQFIFAKGKVIQTVLPPDTVKSIAKPGPVDLSFEIIAFKQEGANSTKIGSWTLSTTRKINLLPEAAPPAP